MREDVATDARARHGGDEPQTAPTARTRHPQRGRQFERNLDILVRLWTEERVTLNRYRPEPVERIATEVLPAL